MIIFRVMCLDEYNKTIKSLVPSFIKRYKWFSTNLEFIKERVLDGRFNNSNYITDRYEFICMFEWDGSNHDWIKGSEIQFDRRKNPNIKYISTIIK